MSLRNAQTNGFHAVGVNDAPRQAGAATASDASRVVLAHGGGGQLTDELLAQHILPRLSNNILSELLDSAILDNVPASKVAMTIDGYVVQPWKFPGGNIGRLAVSGTVNDLAVSGAEPLGIALSLILEEGFPLPHLDEILDAIAATAREAGVKVITGDTKVVQKGAADGVYVVSAGVGTVCGRCELGPKRVEVGQKLVVNGCVGEHGLAVMLEREMPEVKSVLTTDAAPLNGLIRDVRAQTGTAITFMRDPTRGGLAGLCADLARQASVRIVLDEPAIPTRAEARHAADMLGLDILEIANEGKVVMVVDAAAAEKVVSIMRAHPLGRDAAIIGEIIAGQPACELKTSIGGRRIVQKPYGEQLPRIC